MTTARKDTLLARIGAALEWFAQIGPRIAALDRLFRDSDAELARRGTTREAEAVRIIG